MRTEYITLDLDSALSNASLLNGGNLRTQLALQYSVLVCGVDEVGRGALFGPVVAAAVILTAVCARACNRQN
jgi:ribonuclease HII